MRRRFDIATALTILLLTAPFLAIVAVGIRLSSPGPVFHRARRVGKDGMIFQMLKFRSMHVGRPGAVITAERDPRVFAFGRFIRAAKLDELPQMLNVLRGDMAIVGPRPEDPAIVKRAYRGWMRETLAVRPGVTGPGSIFYYGWGEALIDPADPEASYIARLLPAKLALERAYMDRATWQSDVATVLRTGLAILGVATGRPVSPDPRDMEAAAKWTTVTLRVRGQAA
ncbi:sugar transferase [Palleronia sp.]|uniref:sugar transferase n=1 Tax=Palleronia sp. TaxID=1940284 RepID=UPI0035C7BE15